MVSSWIHVQSCQMMQLVSWWKVDYYHLVISHSSVAADVSQVFFRRRRRLQDDSFSGVKIWHGCSRRQNALKVSLEQSIRY